MVGQQEQASRQERWDGWQLQGNSAEAYEHYLVPVFFAPGAQYLIGLAGLGQGERVLDVATGTGIVARTAAEQVGPTGTVAAVDLNDTMLSVARQVSSDIQPKIEWRLGDAQDLPYKDSMFDVVFCQQGFQFFPDRPAALDEMYRVLVPGGRLALAMMRSTDHNPSYGILSDVLERHAGPEAGAMMRSPFPEVSTAELRGLITGAGFQDVRIFHGVGPARYPSVEEFVRQEAASSPLARPIGALPDDVREAMLQELRTSLNHFVDDDGIVFPTETYLAVARR